MDMYQADYQEYAQKWALEEVSLLFESPASCLYKAVRARDRQPVVLKFTKCRLKAHYEAMALRHYDGAGAPRLLDYDEEGGVILQEQIIPGVPLIEAFQHRDLDAIRCCVEVIKHLQKRQLKDQDQHQSLRSYLEPLFSCVDFPKEDIDQIRKIALWLLSTMKDPVLLHCDLHPHNILLRGEEEWVVIDPRGVIGEVAYEAPPFICCYQLPRAVGNDAWNQMIQNRLALFAKLLQVNKRRLQAWVVVYAARRACTFLKSNRELAQAWLEVARKLSTF